MSNLSQFQPPGYVEWQAVKTASFTAEVNKGYPIDTASSTVTVTLPASASLGDTIEFNDYSRTWNSNNVTLALNGLKFQKRNNDATLANQGSAVTIVYIDATIGWQVQQDEASPLIAVTPDGNQEYTSAGNYTWTVPSGVTECSVLCVGAGGTSGIGNSGQAGGGGALSYRNAISVTPGQTASVVVGNTGSHSGNNGNAGGSSSFTYSGVTTTAGGGGGGQGDGNESNGSAGSGGTRSGTETQGGNGGNGGQDNSNHGGPGGGGAGGYTNRGGHGANCPNTNAHNGEGGSGGGGGGGGKGGQNERGGGGGGGVGIYGAGSSGNGGQGHGQNANNGQAGEGGSGGGNGGNGDQSGGQGGQYGGGHGGPQSSSSGNNGFRGAVRIIWGENRNFPNNASQV